MRENISIHDCFRMIDTDDSRTISINELEQAIIRFKLGLTSTQLQAFLSRIDSNRNGYISQAEFI